MTLTDLTSRNKGPPEWIEEDQIVSSQGRIGEDIIVELKLVSSESYDDLQFDLIRDGLPISSDRYRLSMRGNVVQLALKQSRKNDTGYYSLVATRLGQENDKGAVKKIHLSVSEASYEEGDPPIFLRRLSDLAVKVGTRTRFLIEIRSSTTPKISWYKDDSPIHEGLRFSLVHEGNFHCVDVAPVTVEDQGCWTCMAENRSGRSSCTSTLTVIVPKAYKRPEFVEELRALLTETGTVSLECKVIGVPTPVLRWFKDSKEIKAGDVFALTANPDDPTSLGVYTCEANNCMGTTYSSSKVHVAGKGSREGSLKPADALAPSGPLPVFKQMLQDECCRIGDTLVLSCRVQVPPWPKVIAWYNKGGRVEPDERYHIIEDGIGGYSIEVKQVEAMDEGEWKCVATSEENMKQFTSCYVAMSIPRNYRKPRFMENLKAVLTEEGLVSFECKVVGFPTPLLRWFKDGQELKPGDVYQLTGTNSLGSYCCIARNCMGEAKSTAELTIEDIQNQLNEEERFQLLSTNQPPKFVKGLRSCEAKINEDFRFTVQVSIAPEPSLSWYRDDALVEESDKYHAAKENLGTCHLEVRKLEFIDQAEWKCVAANDFGHSVTSCFLKLIIPKHYKKPKFLESLRAILSEEGAVNLECKVIGVPQPVLKWYKDNVELKPGDIHRIISGQDGTCCLGTYTCEAINCMGTVSSSASLLGFEDKKQTKEIQSPNGHELARNLSLSTIHEERTSQLYDTPQTDHSVTLDDRGEVSFSFDGKEVSVSLYETPDLTEEEALQIVEMYADQLSEHVTEHNVIELPPMRFVKETSTSGNLLMEAVVIDVSPDYFVSAEEGDDLRTEADFEDVSIMDDVTHVLSSPERDSRGSLKRSARYNGDDDEKVPSKPPRKKSTSISSSKSEKSQRIESESFHSAQKDEPPLSPLSSFKQDDSDTFADALSSAHLSITESLIQKHITAEHDITDARKRSLSAGRSTGSSLDDGIGGDSSFDSMTGVPKKKQRKNKKKKKDKSNSEEYSGHSDYEGRRSKSEDRADVKIEPYQSIESVDETGMDIGNGIDTKETIKKSFSEERLLDNLTSVTEAINVHTLEETRKLKKDILLESRMVLRKALETYEKVPDTLVPRFSSIRERVNDVYQTLEISKEKNMEIETLIDLEEPLHALLRAIDKITSAEDIEIIRNFLEPSILQLSYIVENLGLSSLQPTLTILRKINKRICNIPIETEGLSSIKSIADETRKIPEEILDILIDIQSAFNAILDYMECSKLAMNGTAAPQQVLTGSRLAACLVELRECVSHTAHTAMTLKENETLNSLMEFREPLLDLQVVLASEEHIFWEITLLRKIIFAIEKLKNVIVTILKNSKNPETIARVKIILQILEDTNKQISKLMEQLLEMEAVQKHVLKNLNIDQSLSSVHFALSSVLEKQEKSASSYHLITCVEALRQTIGSSAITIANLYNPIDNNIIQEINELTDPLLNLQKNLLTEKHEPEEEQILINLINPINKLKEIIHSITESGSSVELIMPMIKLLEEIEKDVILVAKEISKKKSQEENARRENTDKKSDSKCILASQISRSLEPIKQWLSTSEDSTKDEIESTLSLTIEELKRDVTQIAIQTSYSEPPNDESLIEALIDLREPLIKLKNAISIYHRPEDLLTLENLGQPMKHLLHIITDILHEHAEEERLKSIVDIVEQIENQIPLSIEDALHQQELGQSVKTFNVEEEEEAITVSSRETIPGTLTEIASTPFETGSTTLPIEQLVIEDTVKIVDDVALQAVKADKQKREENAGKLITVLSETLEKLQLEITGILEDFEESATRIATIPQSKLANFLEELRRTISTIRMITTVYDKEIGSSEEKVNQTILLLTNLTQPLTNIQELLSRPCKHDVSELMILNQLTPLLNVIENNVIKQTIDFVDKNEDTEKEFEFLVCVLKDIKAEIPTRIQEISSKQKILECLRDISKPLDTIVERMNDLEKAAEETLETDVANILGKPIAALLKNIKTAIQEVDTLDRREPIINELRNLLEPLIEFHTCLSMIQSIRRSLVPEASLLDERRNVILRAVDDLRKKVCHTVEAIANMEEASLFNESLMSLNSAILQVQKQIGKTDYSRRSSSVKISLQHRLTGTLNRLANAIITVEEHADRDTYGILSKCLEALQKQISFTQMQFIQIDSESIDEEAIVEGFLYPTNQLLSALNILKEKIPSAISHNLIIQFQELADSISELNSSLSAHKAELIQGGASIGAPIVETFCAVTDVLNHVKDSIMTIEKIIEQKESKVITKVESVTDEIIEISQEEIESVIMITEIPSAVQEVAQSKIEDTPKITQTPVIENLEAVIHIEQTEDNLADTKKYEENREENEKREDLINQMSKFNSAINSLAQPLRELINFVKSATQESLTSKSEENKRKIQELTALVQILYDLQATNISIKTALSSSSIILVDNKFSRMEDILTDFERAIGTVISLTDAGVRPELKENIMTSLQSIAEPLDALENILASICQTFDGDKYVDRESLSIIAKELMPCIKDTVKYINEIQILKSVRIADEKETEKLKIKEEANDIEETTARPLEELIEAIMDSQDQVKCDKTSLYESSSPSADSIESKSIDNLQLMEVETQLNETLVKKADDSMAQDTVEISQQELTSAPASSQIGEILTEKKEVIKSVTESLEEVKEQNLGAISQQKIELIQVSEKHEMQEKQIKVETLQAIISPLQVLHKSFDEIGEIGILESSDKKTIAFSTLIEPLLTLKIALPSEVTEEIKQDTVPLEKLSITCVLQELQKSIATIQEQVQLNTVAEASSSKTSKMRLMQAIEKPLEDLKMSIACIQSDPITSQLIQQKAELSSVEQITILQTLAKSVEQFGERFMSITNEIKIEAESVPPLQIVKQKDQEFEPEILHKIVDPIHILRETLSQIEELKSHKAELLEIPEQKREIVQLNTVMNPLEKLEQLLITDIQQITVAQEKVTEDLSGNQVSLASADLKPVLEELRNSIVVVQQQAVSNEDSLTVKTLNEAFENLKTPLTIIEEIADRFDEVAETEKLSTLLTFAKSVEETVNQLAIAKQNVMQQEMREISLLKAITIPIEGLQSAILKLEDQVSQTLETKESIKLVALECIVQPLQELQQSFLIASHQEIAQSLQRLPIKPILDNLSKSLAVIQDQTTIVQDLLAEANTDDLTILKDFAKSLGNLRTSTVVLQQLNAIENAGQQIVEIENASALQAFAKSIEEFKKCCSVVVERPRVIEVFATNAELKQSVKTDTQLLESIIEPLRILQEQILTIEETKMQESEILDITETKKPVTVLSSLVGPLQQLEKSFIATVRKEHVIEHDGQDLKAESSSMSLEKLALQPILEEVQKCIATVQEHVILEAGSQIISETETDALLKSIAQPLVDLRASVASIQQVAAVAPDPLNELAQQHNISALETFAETLHNLSECIAMCNHQQIIMEPVADTFSEDASSLNTWADVIDEQSLSKVTRPMVIDQGAIESPVEIAISISEDEASALKTLAKPLTELRECLALVVEERKVVTPSDTMSSLSERENVSLLKTMIQPLLELKDAATAVIIQEQTTMERANEHSFAIEGKNEFALHPLMEPLEELRHSIAVIQDQMLVETSMDRPKNDIVLDALAEPLFDLQRAISVLEARIISPDVESMPEDTSNNWITECLAVPLHEIERSIADIRQCTIIEPETVIMEEQIRTSTPNWSIVEELSKPMENIKTAILRMEDDYTETEVLKTMAKSLTNVQESLMLLTNKYNLNAIDEETSIDAIINSLFNLEKCISFVKREIVDKPMSESSNTIETDTTISAALNVPLNELKYSIVTVKESPSIYLKDLKRPLELLQDALEAVISIQRNKKLLELSTKIMNTISNINTSVESIGHKLEEQQMSVIEICIECEALGILTKPLQNIKQCIAQIQEKPSTELMINALQSLEKSVAIIQQQSADKPLADPQHTNFGILSKNLIPCLHELQESMEEAKTLWHTQTILEGLTILEKPICKLQSVINIICDQFLVGEMIQTIEKQKKVPQKKSAKKEIEKSEIETSIEKEDEVKKTIKVEIEETKLTDNADSTVINDTVDKEEKKSLEIQQKQEKEEEKSIKEKLEQPKDDIVEKKKEKEEEYKKIEKQQEYIKETDKIKSENEERKKEETEKINKEQKSKEIEQVREEAKQNETSIKDKKIKKDKKERKTTQETESLKKEEVGEIKQIEKQQEEMNVTESIKNEIEKSKKITETGEIKSENNEQNKENREKINKVAEEQKKEQETVQERKESDKSKKTEKDLSTKVEKTDKNKAEEIKDKVAEEHKKEQETVQERKESDESKKTEKDLSAKVEKTETNKAEETKDKVAEEHKKEQETVQERKESDESKKTKKDLSAKVEKTETNKAEETKDKVTEEHKKEQETVQERKESDESKKTEKDLSAKVEKTETNKAEEAKNKVAEERKEKQETVQERKESDKSKKTEKDLSTKIEKTEKNKAEEAKDKVAEEHKKEQETVQERKESDKSKKTEKDVSTKVEKTETNKAEEAKDTENKKVQAKEKKEAEIIEKEKELKDIKENERVKDATEHSKKDEIEKVQKEEKEKTDRTQQKEQEHIKIEETEIAKKEKDTHDNKMEVEEIKKQEESKTLKKDKKEQEKENEKAKSKKTEKLKKEKEKLAQEKQLKREKDEKSKDEEKTKEMEKKKEESSKKDESAQEIRKKQEQVEAVKTQEQKEKEITEKVKEKEGKEAKDDVEELETKKEKSNKIEECTEKKKEKEQKQEDKVKISKKEDEEQKQTTKTEKIKVAENQQAETKKDMQEDKKKITQEKDKQEDKKIEKKREEQIEKEKEEIVKIDQVVQQTQNEYIKKENDEDKSKQKYKDAKKDQELEEKTGIKQKQEEKSNQEIQKLQSREDKDLCLKVDKYQETQKDDAILQKRQEQKKSQFEKIDRTKRDEEQRPWRPREDENWLRTRKEERVNRNDEYRLDKERKEEYDRQKRDDNKRLHRMEMERLENKQTVGQSKRDETDYIFRANEERFQKRSEEKRIRGDETARLLWEEGQKLRKRQEEEIYRNNERRKEQIRESEWSRRRENESDRFLKNMLETRYKPDKSTAMFFDVDYSREYTSRFDSGISTLSSTSRSYSWRDSLTSLSRRRIDDYWDYKLHGSFMDKYYFDAGSSYRRRKKRENRMIRARSTSLLKYEDYSTGDSDATIVPSTRRIRPIRRTKTEATPRINFDIYEFIPSSYPGFGQSEDLPWDKPKKPSFCTRLTNRIVGTGMRTRLTCTVLGNPEPRVYWTRDGQKLDVSDSRCRTRYENGMAYLELYDALPTDAGIYACVAENTHGISSTESTLRVYSDYKPAHTPPTFVKSIKDTYRYSDQKLILECRVRAHPTPSISWLKDGRILEGERYEQIYLDDDIYRLEIANPNAADNGRYTCRAVNELHTEEISHIVHVEDWQSTSRYDIKSSNEIGSEFARRPRFSNLLKDYNVPAGGTIALQVEVKGTPAPEVRWLRGDRKEPIAISKAKTFAERGLHTLIVPEATESERGTYVCRAINAYGQVDTSVTVDVISSSAIDGGKPAVFVSRPSKKSIDVTVGEDVSISFRVNGTPKPRVIWMKGLTDITDGPRSYKESIDDYVRLTLKRAVPSDEGTYCILVKNRYGCDRSFFSIKVKQRARSLTPSPDWNSVTERDAGEEHDDDMSYVRNVPGPISSEPVAVDGGKNWLSLTWGKAERRGPAPVIAYKVDAWLLGSDGGARWVELGITPINTFDAFNLRPGGEYKFRVTPRNRYGWGEPVTMTNSVLVSESTDLPEFTKILPGQLKALEGTSIKLECEIRGDSKMDVRWYRETTEIDSHGDSRFAIHRNGSKCFLTIANIREDDSGRYVCEANNKIGKVSSFARVLVVNDPRIIEADIKLRTNLSIEPEDKPPQFTMRIRDRRVQTTYPVRLTCQVIGHPVPEITWYKNEAKISQDDRHIFWDDDSNFHTLEIIHSTLDDSGCYMVTARNVNGSVSCRCNLVVDKGIRAYVAPEFLRGLDAAYTIHSGGELRMSAQLEAYPSVGVVWHRDGIRLRPNRRAIMTLSHDGTVQFSLPNITSRDAGVYSCTATNAVGHTETSTRVAVITDAVSDQSSIDGSFNIMSASPDIPYSKEPLFVTKPLSTEAVEGDTVIIFCEVVGDPKPEVIWLRDFLKPDYYKDAPHFRLVGAGPQYRLEIPYAKLDFTGTYSVIARNCHGEAKAIISLQIYAKGQGKEEQTQKSHGRKVMTLPIIKRELRDLRCCDGDAVSLECKVYATPEPPLIRWERGGKIIAMTGDFAAEFDGETARLSIQHVYPEDEGEYTCVAYNDLGKAYTSACLVVDVPEGKENILSQRLTRPVGLLSAGSTPRSTPRSTPIRSLSPAVSHGREFRSPQVLPRGNTSSKRPKVCPPKFYAVPHNRLVQEGETVRFQCAVVGHPTPWVRWDKNGSIVTPSARISIKERDDVKILEIVDVMREDAALYRVTAENDFGRIEASARLEVISRYDSTSRTIRTRSASPRTYPSFDRSLLSTTSRISERLQLECRIRGTPSVTPTWYRNGRPLERSTRIKRYFDGTTARIEISKVKASDAGEYTCVASNVLGSTRNTCQVTILDPRDSSIADKDAPRFLRSLPEESIVMENHCHEFQTGVTGTPPFTVTWSKDGRELPDNDYYRYVIYGDGGIALRLSEIRPQDAGEYTCVVRNDFGVASCSSLFAVQDYKDVSKLALQFTKTPLSVLAVKGATACFCVRTQCEKTVELTWTINGKDARENTKCKIERDGNVSILRIRDISSRDTGEIRCTASVNGKGPSISCVAKLRLQRSLHDSTDRSPPPVAAMTKPEDIQSHAQAKLSLTNINNTGMPEKITELSLLKHRRRREESPTRTRSSSFPRRIVSYTKNVSPLPARKCILNNASADIGKSRFGNDLLRQRITKKNLDSNVEFSNDRKLSSSLDETNETDISMNLLSPKKTEQVNLDINTVSNEKCAESILELMKATIVKDPADVTVFKGNSAVVRVTYQGRPEPMIKWLRVNRELQPDEKIRIISGDGTSCLTIDNVTYDHAGKYEVSVENLLGKERRFFSLAVEGPPEPVAGKPSVNLSTGQATIVWRSPPYDGGRTVIGYTVEAKHAGESTWTVITESCHSLSHTVLSAETNSVTPGESYRFRVRAENIHGLSDPSMESDPVRIPKQGETMLQEEDEDEFEPSFAARIVELEEGRLFGEKYDVLEELGKGRYGIVKKVIEQSTGMSFAAKFVKTIKAKDREQVREEIKIMNALRHPKLLLLAAAYESPRETILITEYISGGELFERVVADDFTLTERDSILFMRQICQGVEYMHKNKIVHLDLKPENIMCRTRTSHQIKLIDFGLAQTLKSDTPIRVLFGTPEFIPPEIISYEPIGIESDMWSVGVICYVLLTGLSPFMGDNDAETFANITRADYDLEDEAFDAISNNAKDFISGLLIKRKELRMSATQCLEHPWIAQHVATMSRIVLPTEKLKKFIIRRKWQKTGNAIRALGRMAILSAYNRRSPTATAESSPTLEQRFEMQYSDDRIKSIRTAIDEDTERVVTNAKENSAETESWTHPTCVTEGNTEIQKTPTKEESSLNDLSNQIKEKASKLHIELIPKIQDITTRLEILASKENEKSDKELIEKSSQMDAIPKSQALHRVFRGDSRDSGIGDCGSSQMTSSLQIDELEIESTIVEEVDHETHNRESKRTLRKEETRQSSTGGMIASLAQDKKNPLLHDTGIITVNDKVATKSDVTKASCETNPVRKVADENTNARILSGRNRDRFLPTGNIPQRTYPAALVTGKPHNERIQKAFAFWNK
ncbi:Myosin light chain kinase, smooth muscle [Formica fusca]